ncbi:Autophagy-related protein 13a [Nymphaea thermarum]|nr:Autophagy-related protein 13a [Nymphaea thermarum]
MDKTHEHPIKFKCSTRSMMEIDVWPLRTIVLKAGAEEDITQLHVMAHSHSGKAEQIISEFYLKSLQIILESRIPCIRSQYQNTDHCVSGSSRSKRRDKWFSLAVGECLMAAECMNMWYKNVGGPLVLDVILVQETGSEGEGSSLGVGRLLKQNKLHFLKDLPSDSKRPGRQGVAVYAANLLFTLSNDRVAAAAVGSSTNFAT